jgi:hypothetical protein
MPTAYAKKFRAPHTGMGGLVQVPDLMPQVIVQKGDTTQAISRTRSKKHARRCAKRQPQAELTARRGTIRLIVVAKKPPLMWCRAVAYRCKKRPSAATLLRAVLLGLVRTAYVDSYPLLLSL